jgi:hypothetical protein
MRAPNVLSKPIRPFFLELALSAPFAEPPTDHEVTHVVFMAMWSKSIRSWGACWPSSSTGYDRDTLVIFTSDNGPWFEGWPGLARAQVMAAPRWLSCAMSSGNQASSARRRLIRWSWRSTLADFLPFAGKSLPSVSSTA